ncbi:hypothetical protein MBN09_00265 [Candidatus Saccharibacteria bacterium]|nr:hypothetical protein [Candidatus Saccharibacteria bacterium]
MEGFLDKRKLENEASFKEVLHVLDEAYNLFSLRFCWSDMIETTNAETRRKDYDELQNTTDFDRRLRLWYQDKKSAPLDVPKEIHATISVDRITSVMPRCAKQHARHYRNDHIKFRTFQFSVKSLRHLTRAEIRELFNEYSVPTDLRDAISKGDVYVVTTTSGENFNFVHRITTEKA